MDIFKLAFETTVVGLLAFLWIALATYLLFPAFVRTLVQERLPAYANQTLLSVAALTAAYCLGSAILPIANQLVNDDHWPLTENAIRCQVFTRQEQLLENTYYSALPKDKNLSLEKLRPIHCSYWAPVFAPARTAGLGEQHIQIGKRIWKFLNLWVGVDEKPDEDDKTAFARCEKAQAPGQDCDEFKQKRILALFQLQEKAALNLGSDKTERLRQLHERIVVLRGAVSSGFVLFLICLFAFFAREPGQKAHWISTACGILLGLVFAAFALLNGYRDLIHANIFDIPVLESLLAVITIFGGFLVWQGSETRQFQRKRYLLLAIFFAGLSYGGWMWSEIIYDQEVINSFTVLQAPPAPQP
jgi:hypothetical protein